MLDNIDKIFITDQIYQTMKNKLNADTNEKTIKILAYLEQEAKYIRKTFFENAHDRVQREYMSFIGSRFCINYKTLAECIFI